MFEIQIHQIAPDGADRKVSRFRLIPIPEHKEGTRSTGIPVAKISYEILGERRSATTATDMYFDILATLIEIDPDLIERLAPLVQGRVRNHIAPTRELVYPRRPDLAHDARKLPNGWYLGTNISTPDKIAILRCCCNAAGLVFGKDIKIAA